MAEHFEVADLVKIAVEDEKSGVAFYSTLAQNTKNQALKETFADLAAQEKTHQKRFESLLGELGGVKTREEYSGQYLNYLNALTSGRAFPDETAAKRMAFECKSDREALDLASRFERDTLVLMNEMRGLVPAKDKDIVDELAREEQSHLVTLDQARAKLA